MAKMFEHDESGTKERARRFETGGRRTSRVQNPVTPIPRRASASSPGALRVRPKYPRSYADIQDEDVTRIPTTPQSATWQGEIFDYEEMEEIEHNLAMFPLIMPDPSPLSPTSSEIDELDTLPRAEESFHAEVESPSVPNCPELFMQNNLAMRFPLDLAEVPQQNSPVLQFPIEVEEPAPQSRPRVHFPLEVEEEPRKIQANLRFPLEVEEAFQVNSPVLRFPVEIVETPQSNRVGVQFPLDISEQTTNPPPALLQSHHRLAVDAKDASAFPCGDTIVEVDTVPSNILSVSIDIDMYPTSVEDIVDVALRVRARELRRQNKFLKGDRPAFIHDPLDYIRWWLLSPGRLEFLFWLGGALLLGTIMCVVLVMTGLGLGFMSFGHAMH